MYIVKNIYGILSQLYITNGRKREGIEMKMLQRFDLRFDGSTTKQ